MRPLVARVIVLRVPPWRTGILQVHRVRGLWGVSIHWGWEDGSIWGVIMRASFVAYSLDGVAYNVSMTTGTQVYRFYSPSKGVHFYSSDPTEIAYVRANLGHVWSYEGPAYRVGQ